MDRWVDGSPSSSSVRPVTRASASMERRYSSRMRSHSGAPSSPGERRVQAARSAGSDRYRINSALSSALERNGQSRYSSEINSSESRSVSLLVAGERRPKSVPRRQPDPCLRPREDPRDRPQRIDARREAADGRPRRRRPRSSRRPRPPASPGSASTPRRPRAESHLRQLRHRRHAPEEPLEPGLVIDERPIRLARPLREFVHHREPARRPPRRRSRRAPAWRRPAPRCATRPRCRWAMARFE